MKKYFLIAIFIIFSSFNYTQTLNTIANSKYKLKSFTFSVGLISLDANLSFSKGNKVVTFKLSGLGQIDDYSLLNAGVMYEVPIIWSRSFYFSSAAGLGVIWGSFNQVGNQEIALNVPIETKMILKLSKKFGLGIFGLVNINQKKIVGTVGICLHFGR